LVSPWLAKPALAGVWDINTVDSTGQVGRFTSIALDADGYAHISYYDDTYDDLKYAAFNGSAWDINTVDSTEQVGRYTSIALDTDGYAHISYYDDTYDDLKYAAFNGATWDINTVDSTGDVGESTSIALDADGYARISYYDDTYDDLKYAYAYCGYVLDGDRNDDCKVELRDFVVLVSGWQVSYDMNDLAEMTANWLIDCDVIPGNPNCVPK
jgi:hypothetical protein